MSTRITCDCLVIGSGPGGATTAMLMAEAGRDCILVEDGQLVPQGEVPSYSMQEMNAKYRFGGLSVSMGNPKVSFLEARCVGGASEVNAGLYNVPSPQTLDAWAKDYAIKDFSAQGMTQYFTQQESELKISKYPAQLPTASVLIKQGAAKLGWQALEIPRMWDYHKNKRQSMSETFIPRFVKAKGRLLSQTRIGQLKLKHQKAYAAIGPGVEISFNTIFVCAGAIQTPLLLRRSGIKRHIGNSLSMHPAVRVIACFDKDINDPNEGVPVYQVTQFKPNLTLGGSYSGRPHLGLWLAGRSDCRELLDKARKMAIFYALITAQAKGRVRPMPFGDEALVNLPMSVDDWANMHQGLERLEQLLLAAGARDIIKPAKIDLSTIHLFSSCPMGEDLSKCAVDSFGKAHDLKNVYLNDASILPATPGVNPQAVIMAVARRNVEQFLKEGEKT